MKRILMTVCMALLAFGLAVQDAEAKRLGGGMSRGMQRDSVTQRQAAPQPTAPNQQMAPNQASPQSPVGQPQKRSWMGPLAGLAAGIGLAALFSHLGMGEGLGNFVMIMLLVMAAVMVFKFLFRRAQPQPAREPLHLAGVGGPGMVPPQDSRFDASASGNVPTAQGTIPFSRNIPPDFDVEGFLRVAKVNFLRLQAANDAGNLDDIREFTTPEMYAEIKLDIDDRRGTSQQTDVVTLDAELLEVVTEGNRHVASVRFHGMLREQKDGAAEVFDEVWNLVKPVDSSRGWQVAGIQQLN